MLEVMVMSLMFGHGQLVRNRLKSAGKNFGPPNQFFAISLSGAIFLIFFLLAPGLTVAQSGFDGVEALLERGEVPEPNYAAHDEWGGRESDSTTWPSLADYLVPRNIPETPENLRAMEVLWQKLQVLTDKTVPSHVEQVIRGKGGIPFPTEQELFKASGIENLPKLVQLIKAAVIEQIKEKKIKLPPAKELLWCEQSTTTVLPGGSNNGSGKLEYDRLFIRPEDVITKPEELFGPTTIVQEIPADQDYIASLALADFGIDCLPFRLRLVSGITYLDTGKNALRNFSKNHLKGEMHELMTSYLRAKER